MWFHSKISKEPHKKSKSPILKCKFGFRAQKWSKIPPNNRSLNRGLLNFLWVWYISDGTWWILTSRRFRIYMAKGGRESPRPIYGRPNLTLTSREKKSPLAVFRKTFWPQFSKLSLAWRLKSKKFSFFTNFHFPLVKKFVGLLRTQFWCHQPFQ